MGNKIIEAAIPLLKEKGVRMDYFLKEIGMSRSHFYFVKKGERPLTAEKLKKINEILKTNF
jgi:transcriptional regulator with XRE-family HTH domain